MRVSLNVSPLIFCNFYYYEYFRRGNRILEGNKNSPFECQYWMHLGSEKEMTNDTNSGGWEKERLSLRQCHRWKVSLFPMKTRVSKRNIRRCSLIWRIWSQEMKYGLILMSLLSLKLDNGLRIKYSSEIVSFSRVKFKSFFLCNPTQDLTVSSVPLRKNLDSRSYKIFEFSVAEFMATIFPLVVTNNLLLA